MSGETVFLYGPSGAGKNTVGRCLAEALDLPFHDLDERIALQAGLSIAELFSTEGEPAFRARERQELERLLDESGGIVALGGGALLDPANQALAESRGTVLLLTAPLETLVARLQADTDLRPLLAGDLVQRLSGLLERRGAHYASFPLQLDTGGLTPEAAAWQAQGMLGMFRPKSMGAYDVRIRRGALDQAGEALRPRSLNGPLALVSDGNVAPLYAARVLASLKAAGYAASLIEIPAGEGEKTIQTVSRLWDGFLSAGLERRSTVVALGGGVVSDLAGFAAATYLRGVRWAALPSTLLSMADASLGGKTGADLPQGKNLVGAFHPPSLVLVDPGVLASLPAAELRSGLAECLKAGIIADPRLFELCAALGDPAARPIPAASLDEVVRRAVAVKLQVIEADPYEQGWRAVLNLGHTIGHAVEQASGFRLRHGEAVAIGLALEAQLSEDIGLAEPGLADTIRGALQGLGLPVEIPAGLDGEAIFRAMSHDKKRAGGSPRFALPVRIGEARVGIEIDESRGRQALGWS
jgi:shikimate kinase/3-dehydroquinate synthase